MRRLSLLLCLAVVAGCTVRTPVASMRLGPDPAVAGGTFTSPGGVSVAAEVKEIGGKTGICGVWAESENQSVLTKNRAQRVLDPAAVILGNEALLTGLQFLRKVPPARDYGGMEADCVVIERPWRAADAGKRVRINMPPVIIYQDIDLSGGITVRFRPGGPSAHPDDPKPWD
ncbi:hypothetical protein K1T73_14285 [Roseovarius sp. SCSIO 43702]|uniref:hypothetical protein n=1 Tax=Roseovarius sp. SCSIO 43702 TaxID=2823043 RepID=UPI001C7369FF|nr:hypothetical protein [Roseovarius sp. SCSIO 43702]QYX56213.1 hypothetical protein K1T73_14285 [Roseovarius sp. SCSIO 43702]